MIHHQKEIIEYTYKPRWGLDSRIERCSRHQEVEQAISICIVKTTHCSSHLIPQKIRYNKREHVFKRQRNWHAKPDNMPQRCPSNETFVIRSWKTINKIHAYLKHEIQIVILHLNILFTKNLISHHMLWKLPFSRNIK